MPEQTKKRGGIKLRRSNARNKAKYAAQFHRTRRNKIRRLMRRLEFDPLAAPAIQRLEAQR